MIIKTIIIFFAVLCFSALRHAPIKTVFPTAFIGCFGYYMAYALNPIFGRVLAVFFAACVIGLLSDLAARIMKEPTTIFIVPSIIPLVPGSDLYYTMLALIESHLASAAELGVQTLFIAGAIAFGLVVEGSLFKIFTNLKDGIKKKVTL